jgi:hypothetical protein
MSDQQSGRQTPDRATAGGSTRYGKPAGPKGSGHQESRKAEKKEERGFESRQGGSQNRDDPESAGDGDRRSR